MGQPSPLQRLAGHYEFFGDEYVLIRLTGLVEQYRRAVERASLGPDRHQISLGRLIAEHQAIVLVHQGSRKRRGDHILIGCEGDFERLERSDELMRSAACERHRKPDTRLAHLTLRRPIPE